MAPIANPPGFVTVHQSVEKSQESLTTTLAVPDSSTTSLDSVDQIKATLPEYHTAPPWQLIWDDIKLFVKCSKFIPFIVLPLWFPRREGVHYPELGKGWVPKYINWGPVERAISAFQLWYQGLVDPYFPSGEMDEFYPSVGNLLCFAAHGFLIVTQLTFLLSFPFMATFPFSVFLPYVVGFVVLNYFLCFPLNAGTNNGLLKSEHRLWKDSTHWDSLKPGYNEEWIFVNGVSVGTHWLQGNLNRLSRTFHRPITGVHNKTAGIVFDLIQCILERCFYFGTSDTRTCYALIAAALNPMEKKDKIVLIVHSQGGIEGSLILDWILSNYTRETLNKLEIYTFGNAANHYNNPEANKNDDVIGHIEHYGNSGDFVALWGVLHFKSLIADQDVQDPATTRARMLPNVSSLLGLDKRQNHFAGLLFENNVNGHMLNQHYLDTILPLNETLTGVMEVKGKPMPGTFMDSLMMSDNEHCLVEGHKVYQQSRLWKYVNGRSPEAPGAAGEETNGEHSH